MSSGRKPRNTSERKDGMVDDLTRNEMSAEYAWVGMNGMLRLGWLHMML